MCPYNDLNEIPLTAQKAGRAYFAVRTMILQSFRSEFTANL